VPLRPTAAREVSLYLLGRAIADQRAFKTGHAHESAIERARQSQGAAASMDENMQRLMGTGWSAVLARGSSARAVAVLRRASFRGRSRSDPNPNGTALVRRHTEPSGLTQRDGSSLAQPLSEQPLSEVHVWSPLHDTGSRSRTTRAQRPAGEAGAPKSSCEGAARLDNDTSTRVELTDLRANPERDEEEDDEPPPVVTRSRSGRMFPRSASGRLTQVHMAPAIHEPSVADAECESAAPGTLRVVSLSALPLPDLLRPSRQGSSASNGSPATHRYEGLRNDDTSLDVQLDGAV